MPPSPPTAAPRSPQVSSEASTPPPRPSAPTEAAPSELDSLLKSQSRAPEPAAAEPETKIAPSITEDKPKEEDAGPKKSMKDEEFDKFIAGEKESTDKPKEPEKAPESVQDAPGEFKTPKALREAYESTKAERQRLAKELEDLRKAQSDSKALLKQIEDLKKHNDEMEDTFRVHKYENSREYKEKFMVPMEKLYANAVSTLSELEVTNSDGSVRTATPQDLETIVRLPTGKAITVAKEMFGDASQLVMSYREQIKTLFQQTQEARESHKTRWQQLEQQSKAEQLAKQEALEELWKKENEELSTKYSDVFAELEGDDEGNKLIASGRKLADLALRGSNDMTPEQRIRVAAEVRNRTAAFGREVTRRKKAEAKAAELEAKLKGYEESAPTKGSIKAVKSKEPTQAESMSSALEALGALA